jgi:hypothetical protein
MSVVHSQSKSAPPAANRFERNGIALTFPDDFRHQEKAGENLITSESADGAVKFYLFITDSDNFDNVDETVFQKFLAAGYTDAKMTGEVHHERGKLAMRTQAFTAKRKHDGSIVNLYTQYAITIPTDGAKTLLLVGVGTVKSGDDSIAEITDVFSSEVHVGETSPVHSGSEGAVFSLPGTAPQPRPEANHFVFPGNWLDTCLTGCANKKHTCEIGADNSRTRCIVQCGGPLGSDKCTQACNDDKRTASLQCTAESKLCEVKCKTGQ